MAQQVGLEGRQRREPQHEHGTGKFPDPTIRTLTFENPYATIFSSYYFIRQKRRDGESKLQEVLQRIPGRADRPPCAERDGWNAGEDGS